VVGDGGAIAAEAGEVVTVGAAEMEEPPAIPVARVDGALTANWVPVTTVTRARLVTLPGWQAMVTEPVIERATASAAASIAGAREPYWATAFPTRRWCSSLHHRSCAHRGTNGMLVPSILTDR
jgi:hypothetical protein